MDSIVIVGGIVLFVLVWRLNVKLKREREEDQDQRRELNTRISKLEDTLRKVQAQRSGAAEEATPKTSDRAVTVSYTPPPSLPSIASRVPSPSVVESTASERAAESWIRQKAAESSSADRAFSPPHTPVASQPYLNFAAKEPALPLVDRLKSSLDIEEMLGTNWLNKLGIVILVLGVAFFLAYQLKTLGPAGKILVGFVTGGVMLGAGIWFDRKERYRILARAGIGGGWALLFFTTYAMYHIPAAQVLSSQPSTLCCMLAVAAAMVVHTLRYRSQVVTGLAFLLAFLTVTVSHSNVYSLSAGAVLAAGLVVIVGRMQWFELEVFGILASYLNHYLWLRPIIESMHGKRHPFPEFAASAGILSLYWLIFRMSYVLGGPGRTPRAHLHRRGLAEYRFAAGAVQIPVDASGVGLLGAVGDWSDRNSCLGSCPSLVGGATPSSS